MEVEATNELASRGSRWIGAKISRRRRASRASATCFLTFCKPKFIRRASLFQLQVDGLSKDFSISTPKQPFHQPLKATRNHRHNGLRSTRRKNPRADAKASLRTHVRAPTTSTSTSTPKPDPSPSILTFTHKHAQRIRNLHHRNARIRLGPALAAPNRRAPAHASPDLVPQQPENAVPRQGFRSALQHGAGECEGDVDGGAAHERWEEGTSGE